MSDMPKFHGIWKEALEREWVRDRFRECIVTFVSVSTFMFFVTVFVVLVTKGILWLLNQAAS